MVSNEPDRSRPGDPGSAGDGPRICVCMKVHARTLRLAIEAGARSVADLGLATRAGTGCGTCRTDLLEFLGRWGIEDP